MESTFALIVLFMCMLWEIGAKATNSAGYTSSNRLDGEFNELSANELATQIDNCHEACLQKVCLLTHKYWCLLKTRLEDRFRVCV